MTKNPFLSNRGPLPEEGVQAPQRLPASALVYQELRNQIIALELPPGAALARAELAERFNVSQSPVREAIDAAARSSDQSPKAARAVPADGVVGWSVVISR